jgi:hypothetical protein
MALVRMPDREDRAAFDYRRLWWIGSGFLGVMLVFSTYTRSFRSCTPSTSAAGSRSGC